MIEVQKALLAYFGKFGTCYMFNNVPKKAQLPYITIRPMGGDFGYSSPVEIILYSTSSSYQEVLDMEQAISKGIASTGSVLKTIGGGLVVYKASPFSQYMPTERQEDKNIRLLIECRQYTV